MRLKKYSREPIIASEFFRVDLKQLRYFMVRQPIKIRDVSCKSLAEKQRLRTILSGLIKTSPSILSGHISISTTKFYGISQSGPHGWVNIHGIINNL